MKLKCEKCNEEYILGKDTISITSEELMEMMPFVIGQMPKSLQVGHAKEENKNDELFNESGKEDILDMESPTTVDSNDYDEDSNEDNNELESSEDRYDQDYSCKETEDEAKGYGKSVLLHAAGVRSHRT